MLTIVLSVLYWIFPTNRALGAAATVFSILGFIVDLHFVGFLAIIDLIFLVINIVLLNKYSNRGD